MHDLRQLRPVGWRSRGSVDHRSHLAEELWPDLCWADDGQRPGLYRAMVGKPVDCTSWNAQHLPWSQLDRHAIDSPGRDPFQTVKRLLVSFVTMWEGRESGSGRDGQLEHRHTAIRFGSSDQEPDPGHTNLYRLVGRVQPNLCVVLNHECLLL